MNVFVVMKEGNYRHEICGVFEERHEAGVCADTCATNDIDDYHDYIVYDCPLNQRIVDGDPVMKGVKNDM